MESGPAIFTGSVFALFGGGLLLWTTVRLRHRAPCRPRVNPVAAVAVAAFAGTVRAAPRRVVFH